MKDFEAVNPWIASMHPMDVYNTELNEFILRVIQTLPWMQQFLDVGTVLGMDLFVEEVKKECPKFVLGTLTNLYNYLRAIDIVAQTNAIGIIEWYRGHGWIFPPFSQEQPVG